MTAATVLLALLVIGSGIFFAAIIRTWVQPASESLAKGLQAALRGLGGF